MAPWRMFRSSKPVVPDGEDGGIAPGEAPAEEQAVGARQQMPADRIPLDHPALASPAGRRTGAAWAPASWRAGREDPVDRAAQEIARMILEVEGSGAGEEIDLTMLEEHARRVEILTRANPSLHGLE